MTNSNDGHRKPITGRLHVGEPHPTWRPTFDGHNKLSDVWHAARDFAPLLWMLRMSGYQNDRALRLYACWCANQVLRFVEQTYDVTTLLVHARGYAEGVSTREALDEAYKHFSPNPKSYAGHGPKDMAVAAAYTGIGVIAADDPYTAAYEAAAMAENAFRYESSAANQGSDEAVKLAGRAFAAEGAEALRKMIGDPFVLLAPDRDARHLDLLRRAVSGPIQSSDLAG